jgi:uncharacterized protein (TIGR03437 family)
VQASWRDYLALFQGSDFSQPVMSLRFISERETHSETSTASSNGPSTTTLSYRFRRDGLFVAERDTHLMENLVPTDFGRQQRQAWQAEALEDHAAEPQISSILNEATAESVLSPGTRFTLKGSLFQKDETARGSEWALHAGANCVCVGNRPAFLRSLSDGEIQGQLPWLLEPGTRTVRVVREGLASSPVDLELATLSPGIFADSVERLGNGNNGPESANLCNVGAGNGVRAGDTLSLKVTGAGMVNGAGNGLRVMIDGAETEMLTAGLSSDEPGVATVTVRVPPASPAGGSKGLYLRQGSRASNLLPVSYVGGARPTVGLVASAAGLQVQQGGMSPDLKIETQGLNGYCGPVEFEVMGLPTGVTAEISPVTAGETASLRLRAAQIAAPAESVPIYLYAIPAPGDLQLLALDLTVLPRVTSVTVDAVSAGYAAGSQASLAWNGTVLAPTGKPGSRGLYLLVINPANGVFSPVEHYDVYAAESESDRLQHRLLALPPNFVVAMAVADDATNAMKPSLRSTIQARLGSSAIAALGYQHSWAIIGTIDKGTPLAEAVAADAPVSISATLELPAN